MDIDSSDSDSEDDYHRRLELQIEDNDLDEYVREELRGRKLTAKDVNVHFIDGGTPLSTACQHGSNNALRQLIAIEGIDLNMEDQEEGKLEGVNAIITAAITGNEDAVRLLVGAGVDINQPSSTGRTVLFETIKTYQEQFNTRVETNRLKMVRYQRLLREGKINTLPNIPPAPPHSIQYLLNLGATVTPEVIDLLCRGPDRAIVEYDEIIGYAVSAAGGESKESVVSLRF